MNKKLYVALTEDEVRDHVHDGGTLRAPFVAVKTIYAARILKGTVRGAERRNNRPPCFRYLVEIQYPASIDTLKSLKGKEEVQNALGFTGEPSMYSFDLFERVGETVLKCLKDFKFTDGNFTLFKEWDIFSAVQNKNSQISRINGENCKTR